MYDIQSRTSRQRNASKHANRSILHELTMYDILQMHRVWIRNLYTASHKSEIEIVEMLYEQHLIVS
jgi:hypothetical protein